MTDVRLLFRKAIRIVALMLIPTPAVAESDADLAKQLSNPVAALISVPFQFNYDANVGANRDGDRYLLNFQPVIPFRLNGNWNLISRTIAPIVSQNNVAPGSGSQTGLGDVVQSFFFRQQSPRKAD